MSFYLLSFRPTSRNLNIGDNDKFLDCLPAGRQAGQARNDSEELFIQFLIIIFQNLILRRQLQSLI